LGLVSCSPGSWGKPPRVGRVASRSQLAPFNVSHEEFGEGFAHQVGFEPGGTLPVLVSQAWFNQAVGDLFLEVDGACSAALVVAGAVSEAAGHASASGTRS